MTDGGWADYKRSLSGFSGFGAGLDTLKDKVKTDKTKSLELDKLNLGEQAQSIANTANTLNVIGDTGGGLATTMLSVRSFGKMRQLLSGIKDKIGGKANEPTEETGSKNSVNEPKNNEESKSGDAETNDTATPEGQSTSVENPTTGATETPLAETETTIPDTELGAGTETTGEPSGFGGEYDPDVSANFEMTDATQWGKEDFPSVDSEGISAGEGAPDDAGGISGITGTDTGLDVGADIGADAAAEAAADVATDTAIGLGAQALDAIPIVGEIIGAVVGIGAAIAGGIEAGVEASDEAKEADDSKAELSINTAKNLANVKGNSIAPTLTSLSQMPSNAGIF